MVTKLDLAGYESAKSSSGSVPENCERRWEQNTQARQVPGRKMKHLVVDGRAEPAVSVGQPWSALAGPRKGSSTYIQYVGFNVAASSRTYNFDVLDPKEAREFTVQVQSKAFRPAGLKLQDGPDICFARLNQELRRNARLPR
jgi:hypothetical protein